MDVAKLYLVANSAFAVAGACVICTAFYRLGLWDFQGSSVSRMTFVLSTELLTLGMMMLLCGSNPYRVRGLLSFLDLMLGKALLCLFTAGYMDAMIYDYSHITNVIILGLYCLSAIYIVLGVVCISAEKASFNT